MKTKIIFISLICNLLCNMYTFAGWELLQNSPTTNDLHSVFFIGDNTGWIAGYNNTIYKTTNSGESWVQQTSPIASNFECITFFNANTGWACGSGGVVIKTTSGGANWFSQTFTGVKCNSLNFLDENTGYICGDNGIIWKTINGGSNWVNQPSGISQTLHQIKFLNSNIALAVGENAYILRTSNGGNSWSIKSGPGAGNQIFYTIDVWNETIIATGTLTKISTDFGGSWGFINFPSEAINSINNLRFDSTFSAVGANGYIVKTSNSGHNWSLEQSPTNLNLYSVHSRTSYVVWSVGANGTILKYVPNWKFIQTSDFPSAEAIDFIDQNTGWVVSNIGMISKSTDSGTHWDNQYINYDLDFKSVFFTDANTGFVIGNYTTILNPPTHILRTTNSGTDWQVVYAWENTILKSVCFGDANTGLAVGDFNTILKTTDNGSNWGRLTYINELYDFYSVYFADAFTAYIVGSNGPYEYIQKSTNSGESWVPQHNYGYYGTLTSVFFVDAQTGYTVGLRGSILKTINGGTSWIPQTYEIITSRDNLRSVYFLDANLGYVCSDSSIYKTSNGGNNWYLDEFPRFASGNRAIDFVVENNTAVGFAVGNHVLRTSFEYFGGDPPGNSGNYPGWVGLNSGSNVTIWDVDYVNPFIAFAVGEQDSAYIGPALILRTINGGQSWVRQSVAVNDQLMGVSFADVNNGIAVGGVNFNTGIIVRTTNGGANWVQITGVTNDQLRDVDMLDATHAFACGVYGRILYTSNGGQNWVSYVSTTSGTLWGIDFINQTTAAAASSTGIIRTTNTGVSWFDQTPPGNHNFLDVDFYNVNTGIAICIEGHVLRTTNAGNNWVQTDSIGSYLNGISYIDANNVFLAGQDGQIYRSTNGGLNWVQQNSNTTEAFFGVNFTDANNGIIVGQNGTVLRTSNAGVISGTNTSYSRNNLGLPINDFQNTNDSINVNITDKSTIPIVTRLYLKIDTVLHTNDGDLEFYLEHNGITDTLVYQNGGSGDNFLGTFLNDATNFPLVSGSAPYRGSFKPHRPLSKFNGSNPNGYWRLRIYDRASGNTGTLQAWSLNITYAQVIGITGNQSIPTEFKLYQNYPNPFNPVTKIKFSIPRGNRNDLTVKLRIYDILGREVTTLINQQMMPGSYTVDWNAGNFASGVYFYRIEAGDFVESKKMVLVK